MRANSQVRLSLYERGIVDSLAADYGYTTAEARELVVEYIAVVRRLGGYDNCSEYARLLDRARRMNHPSSLWLESILELEKGELRDRGTTAEQNEYLQTR
ncbi:hypothetical protein D3C78_1088010 [compost metagenome]